MALSTTKTSMTMNQALTGGDGPIKKMVQRHKMKQAIKNKNKGQQSYKYSPVKKFVKKVGAEIGEAVQSVRTGMMQRQAMRRAMRSGASDTCDPTKPKGCKTYSPTQTFNKQ